MSGLILPDHLQKKTHIHDGIKDKVEAGWNDHLYLLELYQQFLAAVAQEASKDYQYKDDLDYVMHGSPKWGVYDVFEEWLNDTKLMIMYRLTELEDKKRNGTPSMGHIVTLVREAQDAGQADMAVDGIGEAMTPEAYETFEFTLRKSLETIIKFEKGEINLPDPRDVEGADLS